MQIENIWKNQTATLGLNVLISNPNFNSTHCNW